MKSLNYILASHKFGPIYFQSIHPEF